MSVNSSSSFLDLLISNCINSFYAVQSVKALLLLSLSTVILYLGLQRWLRPSSKASSHVDMFTYQLSVMELLWVCGYLCQLCAFYCNLFVVMPLGLGLCSFASNGELFFHMLTCAERYVAVVHPVTYMKLRNRRGVRIRNISIGGVWLFAFGTTSPQLVTDTTFIRLSLLVFSIIVTCFCSLSVLLVLIRPGPGEGGGGGEKEQAYQSKQRAFYTITAIMSAQLFWFSGLLVSTLALQSTLLSADVSGVVGVGLSVSDLPSSLVLPLLYLHRAGKLTCSIRE